MVTRSLSNTSNGRGLAFLGYSVINDGDDGSNGDDYYYFGVNGARVDSVQENQRFIGTLFTRTQRNPSASVSIGNPVPFGRVTYCRFALCSA